MTVHNYISKYPEPKYGAVKVEGQLYMGYVPPFAVAITEISETLYIDSLSDYVPYQLPNSKWKIAKTEKVDNPLTGEKITVLYNLYSEEDFKCEEEVNEALKSGNWTKVTYLNSYLVGLKTSPISIKEYLSDEEHKKGWAIVQTIEYSSGAKEDTPLVAGLESKQVAEGLLENLMEDVFSKSS